MLETKIRTIMICVPKYHPELCKQSQIMTTYNHVRQQESKNYSIPNTSTPNNHAKSISTTSASILNLHTPTILLPVGNEYTCFLKDGKSAQATRCIKSRLITKVI